MPNDNTDNTAEDKRPWWRKRRVIGGVVAATGGILLMVPATAPVAITIGALPVTWPMLGTALTHLGGLIFGYGVGAKVEREKK